MKSVCLLVISAVAVLSIEHDFKGFDDSILFGINWPGVQETLPKLEDGSVNQEVLKVTTSHKEKYECRLPELHKKETTSIEEYDGPSPINLLKPLFTQKICSYRLESYWSYEVCHGRYIRQYHEEREGKNVRTQEYSLGHWSAERQAKLESELKAAQENKMKLKTTKVEGMSLPYIEMAMDQGTICDLSGKPRLTRVLYVCYTHSKHEIYSFKETATCEYEIIILSPLLCEHPLYKQKDVSENIIDCIPIDGAPKKPRNLLKSEVESLRFNHQTVKSLHNDGETHLKLELHPLSEEEDLTGDSKATALLEKPQPMTDDSPVRAFLNGENCLNGGTGWWKYEFCYGKHVVQYHVDRAGEKTTLLLGKYNEQAHLDWIKENRGKAPKPIDQRTSVSHFYSGGDVCDKTSKPRQTEVKLKCLENSSSPAQVSLYLLEPRTCHYILGVESPLICDILPLADENGLIKSMKPLPEVRDNSVENKLENEDDIKEKDVNKFGFD
ncbi:endoplasmic reticulum lectin 1 isoform X2 [Nymphalis io]|uniref:endoplasmic reticulum lectin 1 isoform X2 n=1 Tax=Inachis io TaxID=171585 RepID=UPI00216A9259|nr:endoplasmic reticulum lectin 1 isoform X2 [Nymphalis io]